MKIVISRIMASTQEHWEQIYETRKPVDVSWFQTRHQTSLHFIARAGAKAGDQILDVGGGASTLVDQLLTHGFNVTVLDLSSAALQVAQTRLGKKAAEVDWVVADITKFTSSKRYRVWHDRAAFHFLTEPEQRAAYRGALADTLAPGAHAIISTFSIAGPDKCSGLTVKRYDAAQMALEFGVECQLIDWKEEIHITPWGSQQQFVYFLLQRK